MAFTGTPVVKQISENRFRITGVALAADASGTIGFSDKTSPAEVSLIAPDWKPFHLNTQQGQSVSLQAAVQVSVAPTTDVGEAVPISIVKTGTTHLDFAITLHNDNTAEGQISGVLEIYVAFGAH